MVLDGPGTQLEARRLSLQADQIDLIAFGGGFAGEPALDIVTYQVGIFGRHHIAQFHTQQVARGGTQQRGEMLVGITDSFSTVNQHGLVHALGEDVQRCVAVATDDRTRREMRVAVECGRYRARGATVRGVGGDPR